MIMRTIKFKAKSLSNSQWIYGDLVHHANNDYILTDRERNKIHSICESVDSNTVCQFTGFLDKNGKEIYEGDVLHSDKYPYSCSEDNEHDNYYAVVYYCEAGACFDIVMAKNPDSDVRGISDGILDDVSQEKLKNFEVVGNIHDPKWKQYGEYFQTEEDKKE